MTLTDRRRVLRLRAGLVDAGPDQIAVEEPLEIRVDGTVASTTMRTPGHDIELALGWLVAEGVVRGTHDVVTAKECANRSTDRRGASPDERQRSVEVATRDRKPVPARLHGSSSACGVCGADLIALTQRTQRWSLHDDYSRFTSENILNQPTTCRQLQKGFASSGGLHAAALFDHQGHVLCVREDVGRHNAVDKVIGWALLQNRLPLRGASLQVSGRASAELVHKAVMAGVPILAAVSAPSTLAVDLARATGLTLVAFVRDGSLNVYSAGGRLGMTLSGA